MVGSVSVAPPARVLSLNCGSSSLKFALHSVSASEGEVPVLEGAIEGIGLPEGRAWTRAGGETDARTGAFADHGAATHALFGLLDERGALAVDAVGHRLVHGGPELATPVVIDEPVLTRLRAAVPFAPLHLPAALAAIDAARTRLPAALEVACFDTGFHRTLPPVARRLPVSQALDARGVRRYGFHGLSCEYVVSALGEGASGRLVIAHLGNGASLTAVRGGVSVDTTMGLTPTGGIVMGTRTGDLDPGVVLFLMREGWDAGAIERLVDHEGGLLGVSGTTPDMKTLLASRPGDPRADLAVQLFCASVRKAIGAMAAVLGGIDRLVFTGGIGEHAPGVRAEIVHGLEHLGLVLDPTRNAGSERTISAEGSAGAVMVVPTDEERMIARHAGKLLRGASAP